MSFRSDSTHSFAPLARFSLPDILLRFLQLKQTGDFALVRSKYLHAEFDPHAICRNFSTSSLA